MDLNRCIDYLLLGKNASKVDFKFDYNLMNKFGRDLDLDYESKEEFKKNSSVMYFVDGNKKKYSFDSALINSKTVKSLMIIDVIKNDILEIEDLLNTFPSYVFDLLEDQKTKLYLTDYYKIFLKDGYFVENNRRLEVNKIIPLKVEFNINLVEAITDTINDSFGDFVSSDYFNKIYEEEKIKLTDILRDDRLMSAHEEIDEPSRFLAWSMYSYYSGCEDFCYRCDKTYEFVKDLDKNLEKLYYKPQNVFTKNKVKRKY